VREEEGDDDVNTVIIGGGREYIIVGDDIGGGKRGGEEDEKEGGGGGGRGEGGKLAAKKSASFTFLEEKGLFGEGGGVESIMVDDSSSSVDSLSRDSSDLLASYSLRAASSSESKYPTCRRVSPSKTCARHFPLRDSQ